MKNNILITTTNNLENAEIERYIDLVTVNVVIGTHFFSDFGATFTDFFGGYSDTYQNKLQQIYDTAIDKLTLKATKIRANAIVGFKLDFDEISGKGKSMFMISATGTAVFVKYKQTDTNFIENEERIISSNELENAVTNLKLRKVFALGYIPSNEQWEYLFNNPVDEFISSIIENYLLTIAIDPKSDAQKVFISNAKQFFNIANKDTLANILYDKLNNKFFDIYSIIETNKLFYPKNIIKLIKDNYLAEAIYCLSVQKDFYTKSDLVSMYEILNMLNNLPDKGKIDMVKGLLSKSKEKYVCPEGHTNDVEVVYCSTCRKNIKGLTEAQIETISEYQDKIEILRNLLN